MNRVLILSPHTDDAELGAGATISKFLAEGKEVFWIVFSTAAESLPDGMPKDTLKNEFLNVVGSLKIPLDNVMICNFSVRKLHEVRQDILEILVKVRNQFKPDLVMGPSLNDFHQDHTVVANEMVRAFKNMCSIVSYELPWNHISFDTQFFVRFSREEIEAKAKLLKNYHSQVVKNRNYFQDEFIMGLARTRGIQVNADYAEAFEVIRWLY